eukprot:COSAG02_NODE_1403_length_12811_cov_8.982536_11_plen_165_part_00
MVRILLLLGLALHHDFYVPRPNRRQLVVRSSTPRSAQPVRQHSQPPARAALLLTVRLDASHHTAGSHRTSGASTALSGLWSQVRNLACLRAVCCRRRWLRGSGQFMSLIICAAGGSSGIGKAMAVMLADQGINIVIVAAPDATLDATSKPLAICRWDVYCSSIF